MKNMVFFKIIISLIVFFYSINSNAQSESKTNVFLGKKFLSFTIKIDSSCVDKLKIIENSKGIQHKSLLDSFSHDDFFITTASVVNNNCWPLGLYCSAGRIIQEVNDSSGVGNFYLKPNGALVITKSDIVVCQTQELNNYSNVIYGIQSGPMLVINDSIHPKFNLFSPNKFIRSGVGTFKNKQGDKFVVFSISAVPVSLYEFASFFKNEFHCSQALNLESSRSVMCIPYLPNFSDNSTDVVCRYIMYDNR